MKKSEFIIRDLLNAQSQYHAAIAERGAMTEEMMTGYFATVEVLLTDLQKAYTEEGGWERGDN